MSNENGSIIRKKVGPGAMFTMLLTIHLLPTQALTHLQPGDTSNNSEGIGTDIKDGDDGAGLHVLNLVERAQL